MPGLRFSASLMLMAMNLLFDSFWRAALYLLHPRVLWLTLLPLLLAGTGVLLLGWLFWEPALAGLQQAVSSVALLAAVVDGIHSLVGSAIGGLLLPVLLLLLTMPLVALATLLLINLLAMPALVQRVAQRRFPLLQARHGASVWASLLWTLGHTLVVVVVLLLSAPLWLIPPLGLFIPPLAWGWLSSRVMAFDALADHASPDERRWLLEQHRWPLWVIGLVSGYLGVLPTLLWTFSIGFMLFMPLVLALSLWLYALVFAGSALWFAHYALAALQQRRHAVEGEVLPPVATVAPSHTPPPTSHHSLPEL